MCYAVLRLVFSRVWLCNPMDCRLPGSSIHGDSPGKNTGVGCHDLLQGTSSPRDQTQVSWIADRFFTVWATREVQEYWGLSHLHTIFVLYWAHLCMKCSLRIFNFLKEISSLSHSIFSLCFFVLIAEEGFLISPGYPLELCIQMGVSFLFYLVFASLVFTAICKASSDSYFVFLHFFFLGMVLIPVSCTMSWTSIHSSLGTLSVRSSSLNLWA